MALGLLGHEPRVTSIRLAEHRVGHRADQRQSRARVVGVDERAGGIRHQQHVRLMDLLEPADRGAVEPQARAEVFGVERAERQAHVLPGPRQIDELEVDHLDVPV